ncbi:hypothetical protein [Pontibacter ramchanderi]|uniref:SpoIIAA-like protein n=1 Tax=Pontibacter ramchanderi TaxID=1179743 RepID=A0A2N3V3R3_9BACT|nr:hypothetical protein [Pontibacter ramchanderi]PKV76262.1 hypothetical protein BD749_1212 [Pontibacter ramchanderi]
MMLTSTPSENLQQVYLLSNDFVEIIHDALHATLLVRWLRPVQSHEYRLGIEETGRVLLKLGLEKLLVNNQRMGVLTMDDQGWLAAISIRMISQSNLKQLAIISSTDFFQQHTNEKLDSRVKEQTPFFDTQYFLMEREGMEWLKGC